MEFFNMKLIFAERLSALRKDRYRTQENFADAMGVSTASIKKWECGEVIPEMKHLFKICELLHCDLDYLIGRIDYRTHEAAISNEYTGLSEKAIRTLHKWKNTEDNPLFFSLNKALPILNMLIEHEPRFAADVLEQICYYISASEDYKQASKEKDYARLEKDRKAMDLAAFHASNGIVGIMKDLNKKH